MASALSAMSLCPKHDLQVNFMSYDILKPSHAPYTPTRSVVTFHIGIVYSQQLIASQGDNRPTHPAYVDKMFVELCEFQSRRFSALIDFKMQEGPNT